MERSALQRAQLLRYVERHGRSQSTARPCRHGGPACRASAAGADRAPGCDSCWNSQGCGKTSRRAQTVARWRCETRWCWSCSTGPDCARRSWSALRVDRSRSRRVYVVLYVGKARRAPGAVRRAVPTQCLRGYLQHARPRLLEAKADHGILVVNWRGGSLTTRGIGLDRGAASKGRWDLS